MKAFILPVSTIDSALSNKTSESSLFTLYVIIKKKKLLIIFIILYSDKFCEIAQIIFLVAKNNLKGALLDICNHCSCRDRKKNKRGHNVKIILATT